MIGKQFRSEFLHRFTRAIHRLNRIWTADLKFSLWRQKHWVAGICQMRENGIQLLFFRHQTMSDACTKQVIGRTRVQLSVDMLAYVIGSLVVSTVHQPASAESAPGSGDRPPKYRFVLAVDPEYRLDINKNSKCTDFAVDPGISSGTGSNQEFQVPMSKRIFRIGPAVEAHSPLEATSTVAIDRSISCLSVKPGWSGMRAVWI
jgi:hypothetical protein